MSIALRDGILAGKTAFIAGGSRGINLGIALGFAAAGAKVAILSRSPERVAEAVSEIRTAGHEAVGYVADVRAFTEVERSLCGTRDLYGEIDIVVSGAAGNFLAPAIDLSPNGFKSVVDIDLLGTFNVLKASYPYLRKPGASLISITAPQAVQPTAQQIHVCAAKAGVNMVTKCLALEWGIHGIRVNAISPGPIAGTEGMRRLTPTPDMESAFKMRIPLGRYGEIVDIAELAIFLASDGSRNMTGAIVDCDGGIGAAGSPAR